MFYSNFFIFEVMFQSFFFLILKKSSNRNNYPLSLLCFKSLENFFLDNKLIFKIKINLKTKK